MSVEIPSMGEQTILWTLGIHLFSGEAEYYRNHSYLTLNLISKRIEVIMNTGELRKISEEIRVRKIK